MIRENNEIQGKRLVKPLGYVNFTGSRSRVYNEVNIGIPLHWSGCFFLLIQCSYGITVYIKLKVWFLVC